MMKDRRHRSSSEVSKASAGLSLAGWLGPSLIAIGAIGWLLTAALQDDRSMREHAGDAALDLEMLVRSEYVCAAAIGAHPDLFERSVSPNVDSVAAVFYDLRSLRCSPIGSVELLDARGEVLAWSGRSWQPRREEQSGPVQDSTTRIVRAGPYAVLTTVASLAGNGGFVRVIVPLSSGNRIVRSVIPSLWLGKEDGAIRARLDILPVGESIPTGSGAVEVHGIDGSVMGFVAYREDASMHAPMASGSGMWILLLAVGLLRMLESGRKVGQALQLLLQLTGLWVLRYGLLWLGISRDPIWGTLGDPAVYASSFGKGLVGSPLDLLLTTSAFLLSVVWVHRSAFRQPALDIITRTWAGSLAFIPFGLLLFVVLSRGYAASLRSIVFDTTIRIYDRGSLLPSVEVLPLLLSALLLSISLLIIWRFILEALAKGIGRIAKGSGSLRWGGVAVLVLIATWLFGMVDASDVLPLWVPIVGLTVLILQILLEQRIGPQDGRHRMVWALAIVGVAIPTLDWHVAAAEREEVRHTVEQRMSPGDAWLTFLMQSDLESIAVDPETIRLLAGTTTGDGEGTAFNLWTGSVMSRQPANSGIVIFDDGGKEVDRFVIGFSTFEQDAILRTVFDGAEEQIYVVEATGLGRQMPIYGAWSTVRDRENRAYGTIATILSPSDEQPLYWAVGTPPADRRDPFLQAEVVESTVVTSDVPFLHPGDRIDPSVMERLGGSQRLWLWDRAGKARGDVLYTKDAARPGRLVATFVPEQDIRWRMFHIAKILLVFALFLLAASLYRYARERRHGVRSALSFRAKMFTVFAVVSTAPLMLLAIYNDQLSEERTEWEVARNLEQTGKNLVARMQELFQSDTDLERGVSNDFCASLAADEGIEFSVYRDFRVTASSRPEIFDSGILGRRLDEDVFVRLMLRNEDMVIERQSIGPVSYAVGYFVWRVDERRAGIIAVPTLFRQGEIEADLAERNAYLLVAYAFAILLVVALGWFFSDRVTRPIRSLTNAAGALGRGEKVPALAEARNDEIGMLLRAFDDMVKELEENRKMLAKVEREEAWREMAKQVAHEIRNPLTPMKLSVQQLLQSFKDKARNREETLWDVSTTLLEQIDALSRIASEFSHFARLPQGKFEKVDVFRSVREASGLFSSVPGVGFSLDLPDGHAHVIADADEVRRVFVNLFRNSIQAMEGEGTITVTGSLHGTQVRVKVEDSGPGVPVDLAEKIFEPNFSTKTDGMGLGLAISRRILEDLGGSITVDKPGTGACFTLVFPLQ